MNKRPGSGFAFLRRTVSLTTCWGHIPVRKRRGVFTIRQGVLLLRGESDEKKSFAGSILSSF